MIFLGCGLLVYGYQKLFSIKLLLSHTKRYLSMALETEGQQYIINVEKNLRYYRKQCQTFCRSHLRAS